MATQTANLGLTLPIGSEKVKRQVINSNNEIIDAAVGKIEDGIAYRLGNTNTTGSTLAVGTYVYVTGNTNGVADGMYKVTTAIATSGSLTTTNLSAVSGGISNALNTAKANSVVNAQSSYGTDLNAYTITGMYGIEGATNCPTGYAYGTLTVTRYSSSSYVTQVWQSVIEEKIFIRHSFNGTWQPWEQLALNSNLTATTNRLANASFRSFGNASNFSFDIGFTPSASKFGHILLFNANRNLLGAIIPTSSEAFFYKWTSSTVNLTCSLSGTVITVTATETMWGLTTVIIDHN